MSETYDFSFSKNFDEILVNISNVKNNISQITIQLKNLEKEVKKKMKQYEKIQSKKKNGKKKPSGFADPVPVSKELRTFMNLNEGDKVARTEVTKYLATYIKQNKLKSEENGRVILPNEELSTLLGAKSDEQITFFNLQRFMNKHFITNNSSNEKTK